MIHDDGAVVRRSMATVRKSVGQMAEIVGLSE